MPAFTLRGRILIYFAAFNKHIGLYPPVRGDKTFTREAAPYAGEKGNLRFPLDAPIPYALITKIVKSRVQQTPRAPAHREARRNADLTAQRPETACPEGGTRPPGAFSQAVRRHAAAINVGTPRSAAAVDVVGTRGFADGRPATPPWSQ